jgi:manganese oxidase
VARFTPNHAGTFIYHTHASDPGQLSGGVYGALIVLDPGETFDAEHDKLLVMGTREADFFAKRITLNGLEDPKPILLSRGVKYRLRLINMAPDLVGNFQIGDKHSAAAWRAIAKDGATLSPRLAVTGDASLHIVSGETYDFEFQPDAAGEIPWQIENIVNHATVVGKFVVQ